MRGELASSIPQRADLMCARLCARWQPHFAQEHAAETTVECLPASALHFIGEALRCIEGVIAKRPPKRRTDGRLACQPKERLDKTDSTLPIGPRDTRTEGTIPKRRRWWIATACKGPHRRRASVIRAPWNDGSTRWRDSCVRPISAPPAETRIFSAISCTSGSNQDRKSRNCHSIAGSAPFERRNSVA